MPLDSKPVVSAYQDGHKLFIAIKKKWREHRRPEPINIEPTTNDLDWSLRRGEEEIMTQWNSYASQMGRRFEDGDRVAREQMKDIVIELQRALLANLRQNNAQLNLYALLQASDRGRTDTLWVFRNLHQRLAQAASIPSPFDFGPVPFDPAERLWYWINLIEKQYWAQIPPSQYTQRGPSSPGRLISGGMSGSPPDIISFLRQMEEQGSPSQSRRSSGISSSTPYPCRQQSSGDMYSPWSDSGARFGGFVPRSGLATMPEMPDQHYKINDRPREGSSSSAGIYGADMDYLQRDSVTTVRLQQNFRQEQERFNVHGSLQEVQHSSARQHESTSSQSVRDNADVDHLTLEMTENPWIMDAAEPTDIHRQRTDSPQPIPEPPLPEVVYRTDVVDTRHLVGMESPWAQQPSPPPNPEQRRSAMMDTGFESGRVIPQFRTEETIRQEHYTNTFPRHHHPPSTQDRTLPQPRLPQRQNSHNAPIPVHIGTPPHMRTQHTPSIASTNSTNSTISSTSSSNPSTSSRILWPPRAENNYAGFCKGAWKVQSGLGGFKVHSEPKGYYTMEFKWRCGTCCFEMPLSPGSTRKNPNYDSRLLTHAGTGIRYRWLFLAKSHMKCKRSEKPGGGMFGCIFCCRERGRVAPVSFEGLENLMLHLGSMHRSREEGVEGSSLLEGARCVAGRVASVEEGFDVNIPPDGGPRSI
ncbi:hypothetical protein F1880_009867 [Penicillium rolfsii]|nr:hypothetical protein F1880_009867 [Penicillium rolfsii]